MSELILRSGEAIYGGRHIAHAPDYEKLFGQPENGVIVGKSFEQLKKEAIAEMRAQDEQPKPVPADVSAEAPAKAEEMICVGVMGVRILRRAIRKDGGRQKATEAQQATAGERRALIAEQKRHDSAEAARLKAHNSQRAQSKAEGDRKALLEIKQQQERLQQIQNRKATAVIEEYTGPVTHPLYHLITTGLHAIPGKVGVVIDSKNTIYVKNGVDIDLAVERHFLNRKVAQLFNNHQ